MLSVGDKAPAFTLPDQDGNPVSLGDFAGSKVVVYFYPRDNTPGCTRQACAFRDSYQVYRERGLALIQKIPTPITPIAIEKESRHITLAYFDQKSTVDYIGAVQGIPVCFDAKECDSDTFPLQNIHEHQVRFMEDFERQEGVAFLILFFSHRNELYYLSYQRMREFWDRAAAGGRKSFRHEELSPDFVLNPHGGYLVPYLDGIQKIMDGKEE